MKTLFVLRHAKSSWENLSQADFDRPLNERGLHIAPKVGKFMRDNDLVPNSIVSSPALRANTTAQMVKKAGAFTAALEYNPRIYEATVGDLLEVVATVADTYEKLLLVGHNPGFENLVRSLTGEAREMPTAALAQIELKIASWKNIGSIQGKLKNLFKPKEIFD